MRLTTAGPGGAAAFASFVGDGGPIRVAFPAARRKARDEDRSPATVDLFLLPPPKDAPWRKRPDVYLSLARKLRRSARWSESGTGGFRFSVR